MGSIMSSIRDDENDWDDFRRKTDIPNWDVYSREARFARKLYETKGIIGRELRLAVRHSIETEDLIIKQAKEWEEFRLLESLKKKYE